MITEIAFTGIPVTDMARARAFYEDVLGFKKTMESAGSRWIQYDIGAGTLAIGSYPGWEPSAQGATVGFEVDNLDEEMSRLKARNVTVLMEIMDTPVCRFAMIGDPDGNKIIIH